MPAASGVDPRALSASQRAGLARRLAASAYEALLLAAVALVVEFALLPLISSPSALPPGERPLPLPSPAAQALSLSCLVAVLGLYCVWGWSDGRRTLPMKTWRIALVPAAGECVGRARAAWRYAACWIGPALAIAAYVALRPSGHGRWAIALLAFNYAWALVDVDRQFLQDRIARTRLVAAV